MSECVVGGLAWNGAPQARPNAQLRRDTSSSWTSASLGNDRTLNPDHPLAQNTPPTPRAASWPIAQGDFPPKTRVEPPRKYKRSLIYPSLTHSLTHSPNRSLARSLTCSPTYHRSILTHPLTRSLTPTAQVPGARVALKGRVT